MLVQLGQTIDNKIQKNQKTLWLLLKSREQNQGVQSKRSPLPMCQALYPTNGVCRPPRPALLPAAWTHPSLPCKAGAGSFLLPAPTLLPILPQGPQESLTRFPVWAFIRFCSLRKAKNPGWQHFYHWTDLARITPLTSMFQKIYYKI